MKKHDKDAGHARALERVRRSLEAALKEPFRFVDLRREPERLGHGQVHLEGRLRGRGPPLLAQQRRGRPEERHGLRVGRAGLGPLPRAQVLLRQVALFLGLVSRSAARLRW